MNCQRTQLSRGLLGLWGLALLLISSYLPMEELLWRNWCGAEHTALGCFHPGGAAAGMAEVTLALESDCETESEMTLGKSPSEP